LPRIANDTPAALKIFVSASATFWLRASKLAMQPTQYSTSIVLGSST